MRLKYETTGMTPKVVVVGGGLAGVVTALRARELGRDVVLLEQGTHEDYECNSRYSSGSLHLAHRNADSPTDELTAAIDAITDHFGRADLTRLLVTRAREALGWLVSTGASLAARGKGERWQASVLTPIVTQGAGLAWRGGGADLTLRHLTDRFRTSGGELRLGHEVHDVARDGGSVRGVIVRHDGVTGEIPARAIVLADGGFLGNEALVRRYLCAHPDKLRTRGARTGSGVGIEVAEAAGAQLVSMESFYGCLLSRDALGNEGLCPYPLLDQLAMGGVLVNSAGDRYADEGRGGPYLANRTARLDDPTSSVVVTDERGWREAGTKGPFPANPNLPRTGGRLVRAESLEELATSCGLPASALARTVGEYNGAVAAGRAAELPVPRTTPSGVLLGDPFFSAPRTITPPYYGVPVAVGVTYTMGGPLVDARLRVLRPDGAAVPGLYAVGTTAGGFEGGPAAGYIGGLIRALTTGYVAAESVATMSG